MRKLLIAIGSLVVFWGSAILFIWAYGHYPIGTAIFMCIMISAAIVCLALSELK